MKEQSDINKMVDDFCGQYCAVSTVAEDDALRKSFKSAIQKDRRELVSKAIEMARENNEGVEITICPEMKYTQQQILEKLEVSDV